VLGFYSKNPDPLKKNRRLEIKVKRPNTMLVFRKEYSIKPLPNVAAAATSAPAKK
jgi:hypothetical protein